MKKIEKIELHDINNDGMLFDILINDKSLKLKMDKACLKCLKWQIDGYLGMYDDRFLKTLEEYK